METALLLVVLLLQLLMLAVGAWVYRKFNRDFWSIRAKIDRETGNVFQQTEALIALYIGLGHSRALPPTRGWAASPDLLRLVMETVHDRKPTTVVECSSGISTLVIASCLKELGTGKVYSLEHDPIYAERTRTLLAEHGVSDHAEVIHAPLKATELQDWLGRYYDVAVLPKELVIDLLVIDGPPFDTAPMARYPAVPLLHRQFGTGATVILDDAHRPEELDAVTRWKALLPQLSAIPSAECEKGVAVLRWS